jgi:hypothetical protein
MAANDFIKAPHSETEFSAEQLKELKRCAEDPVYFISNYCYIQNQALGKVKFILQPYQERIIRALHTNRYVILRISRQAGKSETTCAFAYWFACFHSDKNVLLASNKQKASIDLMNRIKFMYECSPDFLRPGVLFYNRGSIEFDNGSKIWSEATTEDTGRGKSCALVISDELAHIRRNIQEGFWASILPTLSTGGACVIMSTPNGDNDLYADIWRSAEAGTNDFIPIFVPIEEIPDYAIKGGFRDATWQEKMKSKVGELRFRQEYLAEFLSDDPLLIKSLTLQGLKESAPIFVDKGFVFWKEPDPNKTYLIGADVAEGVKQDFSTVQVIELETMEQVAEFRNNDINESQLYNAIKFVISKILSYVDKRTGKAPTVYWSFENNSAGASIGTLFYNDEKFPEAAQILSDKGERTGFRTVNKSKLEACRHLKHLLEKVNGNLKVKSKLLIFELKNYIQTGASYAAKHGATDDLISAMLIIMRMLKQLSEYEPGVFDRLYKSESDFYDETTDDFSDPVPFFFN